MNFWWISNKLNRWVAPQLPWMLKDGKRIGVVYSKHLLVYSVQLLGRAVCSVCTVQCAQCTVCAVCSVQLFEVVCSYCVQCGVQVMCSVVCKWSAVCCYCVHCDVQCTRGVQCAVIGEQLARSSFSFCTSYTLCIPDPYSRMMSKLLDKIPHALYLDLKQYYD